MFSSSTRQGGSIASIRLLLGVVLMAFLCLTAPACAQTVPPGFEGREIVVGTKVAPPFAMKAEDGSWTGLSIELWRHIAEMEGLKFRLVEEPTVQSLIASAAEGKIDAAIAAITITADREKIVDFTQPFYTTGLGVAVPVSASSGWQDIVRAMTSFGFLQAVSTLIGIALLVGSLLWIFERRHNDDFGGNIVKGLGTSIWWSAEAMTQASTGSRGPKTLPGRILAIVWMVASIIAIAVFTASVTSNMTTRQMRGRVAAFSDLQSARVGAVAGSATVGFLNNQQIRHSDFATAQDGLEALQSGKIDAFVYDKPLLAWLVLKQFSAGVEMLDIMFDPQNYGIALPVGSPSRKALSLAILESTQSDWWKQVLFRYLGDSR